MFAAAELGFCELLFSPESIYVRYYGSGAELLHSQELTFPGR